jgi:hypothetical protein
VYSPGSRQQFRRFGAGRLSTDLFGHGNNLVVGASVDRGPVKFTESSDWTLTIPTPFHSLSAPARSSISRPET